MRVITVRNITIQFDDSSLMAFDETLVLDLLAIVRAHIEVLNGTFQRITSCPQILDSDITVADISVEDLFDDETNE